MNTVAEITILGRYLAALSHFAAVQDVRFYLKGICLEIHPTETRLIATTGVRMMAVRHFEEVALDKPLQVIIPTELFKGCRGQGPTIVRVGELANENTSHARHVAVSATAGATWAQGLSLDGRFPEWQRVIPSEVSGEVSQLDPLELAEVTKGFVALNGKKATTSMAIGHAGESSAVLVNMLDPNVVAILMPLRKTKAVIDAEKKTGVPWVPKQPHAWVKQQPGENPAGDLV